MVIHADRFVRIPLNAGLRDALDCFKADQGVDTSDEQAVLLVLCEFLITLGYLEFLAIDEETPVEGSA